jgi:hypothetical protein
MDIEIDWLSLGAVVLRKKRSLSIREFKVYFRLEPFLVEKVYQRLVSKRANIVPQHLLWTLHFLKSPNPLHEHIAGQLGMGGLINIFFLLCLRN